jgi:hypothetical protein
VIVGLRGASLRNRSALIAEGEAVELVVDYIDHETPRCVIVVWRGDHLTVFQGSTVPHLDHLQRQWRLGGRQACLLPTGRYLCEIGTHRGEDGHIPNAVIFNQVVLVHRSQTAGRAHHLEDTVDWLDPDTNVHAARTTGAAHLRTFASAGCLTVPGQVGSGPWQRFIKTNGGRRGHHREVIVLTGAEAWEAATVRDMIQPRIRPGSLKKRIRALQAHLRLSARNGVFGRNTYRQCVERLGVAVPSLPAP